MAYLRANSRRGEPGAELHQTPGVAARDDLGRRLSQLLELGFEHGARHLGLQYGEQAGAAAALRRPLDGDELEQRNRREQPEGLGADALRVQQMTWRIVGHVQIERRAGDGPLAVSGEHLRHVFYSPRKPLRAFRTDEPPVFLHLCAAAGAVYHDELIAVTEGLDVGASKDPCLVE